MIKRDITYKDLDGNDVTDTFEFNLSRAEMAEMALGKEGRAGGFDVWVRRLIESQDGEVLVQTFKEILLKTIGERSEDNKRFVKSDEIIRNFVQSDAYSVLFMELLTDADKMSAFINGVVPKEMQEDVGKQIQNTPDLAGVKGPQARAEENRTINASPEPKDNRPDWLKAGRVPTEAELKGASQEHILEAFKLRSQAAGPVTQEQIPPQ